MFMKIHPYRPCGNFQNSDSKNGPIFNVKFWIPTGWWLISMFCSSSGNCFMVILIETAKTFFPDVYPKIQDGHQHRKLLKFLQYCHFYEILTIDKVVSSLPTSIHIIIHQYNNQSVFIYEFKMAAVNKNITKLHWRCYFRNSIEC